MFDTAKLGKRLTAFVLQVGSFLVCILTGLLICSPIEGHMSLSAGWGLAAVAGGLTRLLWQIGEEMKGA